MRTLALMILMQMGSATAAFAQVELSFYGGIQSAPHSRVQGNDRGGVGPFDFLAAWEGRSLDAPPYYGLRLTWWQNTKWGWALDFSHDKLYADAATLSDNGLSVLEFTDGLNILTLNRYRKWENFNSVFVPYVGAGIGISIPNVEFDSPGGERTFEYQFGGPAASVVIGAKYPLNSRWTIFGEYKGTYSVNKVDLVGGGDLQTNIVTNSFNLGATFGF